MKYNPNQDSFDEEIESEDQIQENNEEEGAEESAPSRSKREERSLVFHLLYAAESFDYTETLDAIVDNFNRGFELTLSPADEVVQTARAVIEQRDELDKYYLPFLENWRFDRLSVATRLILRYAVWELKNKEIDSRIVINEAVELAKCFAETDAYRFINGILDRINKQEVKA